MTVTTPSYHPPATRSQALICLNIPLPDPVRWGIIMIEAKDSKVRLLWQHEMSSFDLYFRKYFKGFPLAVNWNL